jgi:signal transduction histidine kinase
MSGKPERDPALDVNRRILIIDDSSAIHGDVAKLLTPARSELGPSRDLSVARAAFFGGEEVPTKDHGVFELSSAYSGEKGLTMVARACREERPYALAFVDNRMREGWDGVETVCHLWEADPQLQVVICTAYSDYSWDQTVAALGYTDRLLILKKPFDPVEIRQMASALTEKWNVSRRERELIAHLKRAQVEQSAYASSLETMNLALTKAQAVAQQASKSRARFLVQLADQMGSDLSQLLDTVLLDEKGVDLSTVIASSSKIMETLTRVMDLHQLEAGEWGLRTTSVGIGDLLLRAIQPYRARAKEKGVVLAVDPEDHAATRIRCDASRLGQVLTHLVENAVRHTQEGTVTLRASLMPTGDWNRTRLVLSVEDTGPGLAEELQGRPFEPFIAHGGGVGLGLAIVRGLARLMSASVTYEALEGGGTAFRFSMEAVLEDPVPATADDG